MPDTPIKLTGKILNYYRNGWRQGRIVRVVCLKRSGLVVEVTVREPSYEGNDRFAFNGPKVRLTRKDLTQPGLGYYYRKQLYPLNG